MEEAWIEQRIAGEQAEAFYDELVGRGELVTTDGDAF